MWWNMKKAFVLVGLVACLVVNGATSIDNIDELRKTFDLAAYDRVPLDHIKIAVLDVGFNGIVEAANDGSLTLVDGVLPPTAKAIEDFSPYFPEECPSPFSPSKKRPDRLQSINHGAIMAQTAWAMTGNNPTGPEFYLLNANGFWNFRCAVRFAREIAKADIILFSQNYPYGGNFKGDGFVNEVVNQATADGIIWINAAGNYAGRVYNGPAEEKTFRIRSNLSGNPVTISLAWSGTGNRMDSGTDKDLDIELKDPNGRLIPVQNYKQVKEIRPAPEATVAAPPVPSKELFGEEGANSEPSTGTEMMKEQPRSSEPASNATPDTRPEDTSALEQVNLSLDRTDLNDPKDTYTLRVLVRGGRFNRSSDTMRLTVLSPASQKPVALSDGRVVQPVELLEATEGKEIMVPADNPNVITVGDLEPWSARGPTLDNRQKPELLMERSTVQLSSGIQEAGTSHAAAMLAGIVAQMKSKAPNLTRADIIRFYRAANGAASVDRFPTEGSLPRDARPISMDTLYLRHAFGKEMVAAIEKMAPNTLVEAFQTEDGAFILGLNRSPSQIDGLWRNFRASNDPAVRAQAQRLFQNPAGFEYYVSMREKDGAWAGFTAVREKPYQTDSAISFKYPWEGLNFKRSDFIELRHVQYTEQRRPGTRVPNLWKTPSIDVLKRVVAERIASGN